MNNNKKLIILSGPTATGKTKTGIELAKKISGEIVNFDSLLFYKEISIGTAKPTLEEMSGISHHLVSITSIKNPINAADFMKLAIPVIDKIISNGKIPILSGGSGFYLQTILNGMYDSPTTPNEIMIKSDQLFLEKGIEPFRDILKVNDPDNYQRLHLNDHYRIRRAVEHFWTTGKPFSEQKIEMPEKRKQSPLKVFGWQELHLHLDMPKEEHQEIIINRTKNIFELGLIEEVKNLLTQGFTGQEKPLQSIGYKQAIDFIQGEIKSIEEAIELTIIATRQLAKSQRTWFKKVQKNIYHPLKEFNKIHHDVIKFLS